MSLLIAGLVVFLGLHSLRIVADGWRTRTLARIGEGAWKGGYSLLSIAGFVLICWGYALARQQPVVLWAAPPRWTRDVAGLLTVLSFILLAAAYVPGNAIKAALRHPMVLAVKVWALAHLLANNTLADLVLFGSFLVWAVFDFRSARQRDRRAQMVYPRGRGAPTTVAVLVGVVAWALFAFWLHGLLIGVRPFG